jgi:ribosomal protein L2
MPNTENRAGPHDQPAKAGQQSHKNDEARNAPMENDAHTHGGGHEQQAKAGQHSHKNDR